MGLLISFWSGQWDSIVQVCLIILSHKSNLACPTKATNHKLHRSLKADCSLLSIQINVHSGSINWYIGGMKLPEYKLIDRVKMRNRMIGNGCISPIFCGKNYIIHKHVILTSNSQRAPLEIRSGNTRYSDPSMSSFTTIVAFLGYVP